MPKRFKYCFAALAAVFWLSACSHNPPKPYGTPFPINVPASQSASHSTSTAE